MKIMVDRPIEDYIREVSAQNFLLKEELEKAYEIIEEKDKIIKEYETLIIVE